MINPLKYHPTFTHTQDLLDICKPLTRFDITTFVHVRLNHQGGISGLCTNPDFLLNYVEQDYHNADIHVRKNHAELGDCLMWDMMECFGETEKMVADAAVNFDYRHNFTVIKNSGTHHNYYHFGTHNIDPTINQWHINHLDLLHTFIAYFNEKVADSTELSLGYDIVLPTIAESENCRIKPIPGLMEMDMKRQDFLNDLAVKDTRMMFSPRQMDCIKLLVQGFSAKEIAKQLSLSPRTVEDHLIALKRKLKAKNKAELIAKGLEM
jgi:DNA-binding CsgD family transcriptional regulator